MPRFHVWPEAWQVDHPDEPIEDLAFDIESRDAGRAAEAFVEHAFDDLERPAQLVVCVRPFGARDVKRYGVSTRLVPESRAAPL